MGEDMEKKILTFDRGTAISGWASVVGKREYDGPFGEEFDLHDPTEKFGMNTWEKAESEMQRLALNTALAKVSSDERNVGALFAGDLLNQCVGSSYGLLSFDIPYFGLYGACSTAVEGIMLSAMMVNAGYYSVCAAVTSSHNCTAERQYRTPIEYGGQRTPTAQWTVTGSGAFLISQSGDVRVCEALPGIVIEKGIRDTSNMGAAMAPAAADTIARYFKYSGLSPRDFDAIVTGDLGEEGLSLLAELLKSDGLDIPHLLKDCGVMIYGGGREDIYTHTQKEPRKVKDWDVNAGGSGCGCSASVLAAHFLPRLASGELGDILVVGTGAMMSPASVQQGEAIPAVAHLIRLKTNN